MVARQTLKEPRRWTSMTDVPVLVGHLVEHAVAQDAGRIDHRVQAAEGVQRLLDHALDRRHAR